MMPAEVPTPDAEGFWEDKYASAPRVWSGKVNATFAAIAEPLTPGEALELGCGEGADAVWLASRGWRVHGIDISPTAVARATDAARAGGLAEQATFQAADLVAWTPSAAYDLVYSSFLHSPVEFPRAEVCTRAARAVRQGGRLVLVSHAAPPPWAGAEHKPHHASMLRAAEEVATLDLGPDWLLERVEDVTRAAVDPEGKPAELLDAVIVARKVR